MIIGFFRKLCLLRSLTEHIRRILSTLRLERLKIVAVRDERSLVRNEIIYFSATCFSRNCFIILKIWPNMIRPLPRGHQTGSFKCPATPKYKYQSTFLHAPPPFREQSQAFKKDTLHFLKHGARKKHRISRFRHFRAPFHSVTPIVGVKCSSDADFWAVANFLHFSRSPGLVYARLTMFRGGGFGSYFIM